METGDWEIVYVCMSANIWYTWCSDICNSVSIGLDVLKLT